MPAGNAVDRRRSAEYVVRRGHAHRQDDRHPEPAVQQPGHRERVPPRARSAALSHDTQKKAVQLHFAGEGKRKVQVGYVVEAPIWKTSYRLVLAEKEKPYLQGWAMVENPTDEDWADVKMALVSGRPISFKMDLYNPLYVDRPVVEPELFASLRPVTYSGGFGKSNGQRPTRH